MSDPATADTEPAPEAAPWNRAERRRRAHAARRLTPKVKADRKRMGREMARDMIARGLLPAGTDVVQAGLDINREFELITLEQGLRAELPDDYAAVVFVAWLVGMKGDGDG